MRETALISAVQKGNIVLVISNEENGSKGQQCRRATEKRVSSSGGKRRQGSAEIRKIRRVTVPRVNSEVGKRRQGSAAQEGNGA